MIIVCPNCNSTFNLAGNSVSQNISNFKCSVCSHVWENKKKITISTASPKNTAKSYKFLLFLNGFLIILTVLALIFFKDKLMYTDDFWKEIYNFFQYLVPIK